MQNAVWSNVIRFLFLVLLQGIAIEHISLPGNLHWMVYPIFVLLLPLQTPGTLVLLLSFACGLLVDILTGVPGLNAAAMTFMGFVRILFFKATHPKDALHNSELTGTPLPSVMGGSLFFRYTLITVLLFHVFFFLLEAFSWDRFFYVLYLVLGSSLICLASVYVTIGVFRTRDSVR